MKILKRSFGALVPYILVIKTRDQEYVYKNANRKKDALFKTREGAEEKALELSKKHPSWTVIVKQSNGIPL